MKQPVTIIHIIKLLEDGEFRGAYFDKKRNRFIYESSWYNVVKFYAMTKDNAEIECAYQTINNGLDCVVESVVIEDSLGPCAYKCNG